MQFNYLYVSDLMRGLKNLRGRGENDASDRGVAEVTLVPTSRVFETEEGHALVTNRLRNFCEE